MTRVLPLEEIRRWVRSNFTTGDDIGKAMVERELPMKAFCRTVGITPSNLTRFKQGNDHVIGPRPLRLMSRFISDWENGLLEFGGRRERGRYLVHRTTPKARPPRLALDLTPEGPRLKILPKPPLSGGRIFLTAKAK